MDTTRPVPTPIPATRTPVEPVPSEPSIPIGKTIVVTTVDDSGPGSLRAALEDARRGDTITFDPTVFLPEHPAVILLASGLPPINEDFITLDASNAGVVLSGTALEAPDEEGIEINSSHNAIKGLQVLGFPGPALRLSAISRFNVIGGDRSAGLGPTGEGNLLSNSQAGILVLGSDNVITGNLIGTDANGLEPSGNGDAGVALVRNASRNVIGPDNAIAFNGGGGVEIRSADAIANEITANSIYDNATQQTWRSGIDIYRFWGPEWTTWPAVPVILGFDLAAGSVEGLTCPNCTVEVFSTDGPDGEIFEGAAVADPLGGFSFHRGQAFSGPSLVATSRAIEGNTSEFSLPTFGSFQISVLQAENENPKTLIEAKTLSELSGNYIGEAWDGGQWLEADCSPQEDGNFTFTAEMGFKTVRVSLDRLDYLMAQEESASSSFDINPCFDGVLSLYAENGVTIVYTIVYWDEALGLQRPPRFQTEDEVNAYLEYVRFIVRNFGDRVEYFEIFNEAYHYVKAEDYVNLVRKAVQVIHDESPTARVVAGGVAYLDQPSSRRWLSTLLSSDVMPLIDAINMHPMYGTSPDYPDTRQYYYDYPEIITESMQQAEAHGFEGEYIAEEMTWRTSANPLAAEPWLYTEPAAAKYTARAIVINRGLGLWAGISAGQSLTSHTVRNLANVMDGAEPEPFTAHIESEAANIASYTFALPNGERLLALWNDNGAVDYDPGLPATIRIPGLAAQEVTGIDVLGGYEQLLAFESGSGDLAIRSILVKDYPMFIRFTP